MDVHTAVYMLCSTAVGSRGMNIDEEAYSVLFINSVDGHCFVGL